MSRITTQIQIDRPIDEVFAYVSTPANWPRWHPSSLAVSGTTEHSLVPGEQVTEEFFVAGRRGRVVWTVRERIEPTRWVIEGQIIGRSSGGTVAYTLTPRGGGTSFERTFTYRVAGIIGQLLNWLLLRRRVRRESREALRRLKHALETQQ